MASGAKNHRFCVPPQADPAIGAAEAAERRARRDRRGARPEGPYGGPERRQGPRRRADLPAPSWRHPVALALAIGLGIAAGLALSATSKNPGGQALVAAEAPAAERAVPPKLMSGVAALRDEAEALTRAEVSLDERAHARWMPRVAAIEAALDDPATPAAIRRELDATLRALEAVGVLGPERAGPN